MACHSRRSSGQQTFPCREIQKTLHCRLLDCRQLLLGITQVCSSSAPNDKCHGNYLTQAMHEHVSQNPVDTTESARVIRRLILSWLYIARIAGPSKTATRPFPLEGKLLGCFCEVHLPLFSCRPLTLVALSNAAVRSEIYWRFISGFCPIKSNQGRSGQSGHYMQIAQCSINTGDFASR